MRKYIKPNTEITELDVTAPILAGSDPNQTHNETTTWSGGQLSKGVAGDWEDEEEDIYGW